MRIRHRTTGIDHHPDGAAAGFEHLPAGSLDVLRWLAANKVEFVLVGAAARAVRGDARGSGPVAIVPAPYRRNIERLAHACTDAGARLRTGPGASHRTGTGASHRTGTGASENSSGDTLPVKLTTAKLLQAGRWKLRLGTHDLDIEGPPRGAPVYQELLYEAERIAITPELELEVASLEGIEIYDHIARTGVPPEIRVIRAVREPAPVPPAEPDAPVEADAAVDSDLGEADADGGALIESDQAVHERVEPDAARLSDPDVG